MSVEVAVEEPLIGGGGGFLVPLSVLGPEGGKDAAGSRPSFVYDRGVRPSKSARSPSVAFATTSLVVTRGLDVGDLVASAGVSYLADGQKVKLLPLPE